MAAQPVQGLLRIAGPADWPLPSWEIPEAVASAKIIAVSALLETSATVGDRFPYLTIADRQGITVARFTTSEETTNNSIVTITFAECGEEVQADIAHQSPISSQLMVAGDVITLGLDGLKVGDTWTRPILTLLVDPIA